MPQKNPYIKPSFPKFKDVGKLEKEEAKEEIKLLAEAVEYHKKKYYVENKPVISDKSFDKLFERLKTLENKFPSLKPASSPTERVGAPPESELKKIEHKAPMLSLNSSDEKENVEDFVTKITSRHKESNTFVIEPKFDGLSVEVVYENGMLKYAATRGDGQTGEDITKNVKKIYTLPLKLEGKNSSLDIAVRGEILLEKDGFTKINKKRTEEGKDTFANARNAASGMIRQLDPKKVPGEYFIIYFYDVIESGDNLDIGNQKTLYKKFETFGFKISPYIEYCNTFEEIEELFKNYSLQREQMDFDIDGVVIKLNHFKHRQEEGTRQRAPKWAYAWKFQPKQEITTLKDIVVQVGRTGILTPVAMLDSVEVDGVTVSKASLHNQDEIKRKKLQIGDIVKVQRAGDVIPEIAERIEKGKHRKAFSMPSKCPVCGTKVVKSGAYIICPAGLSCQAQLKGSIQHFASREAMNIEHLGEKNIEQLVEKNMVNTLPDLYTLDKKNLRSLEGFSEKKASNLYNAIHNSKKTTQTRFIYALGIPHVGKHMARVLSYHFKSIEGLFKVKKSQLLQIDEIGPEIAKSTENFFGNKKNIKLVKKLLDQGIQVENKSATSESRPLKGKTFVVTGELEQYNRDEVKEVIEKLGGKATSSVSGNTDYLVVGKDPGSKLNDAKKEEDIKIINEKEFLKMTQH